MAIAMAKGKSKGKSKGKAAAVADEASGVACGGRTLTANAKPCAACPYRRDCPSGVWDAREYVKLPTYDQEQGHEPFAVFTCHEARDGVAVCKGWLDVHGFDNLLAVRLAMMQGVDVSGLRDSPRTSVPLFSTGLEACLHGLRDLRRPKAAARLKSADLLRRHPELKVGGE